MTLIDYLGIGFIYLIFEMSYIKIYGNFYEELLPLQPVYIEQDRELFFDKWYYWLLPIDYLLKIIFWPILLIICLTIHMKMIKK